MRWEGCLSQNWPTDFVEEAQKEMVKIYTPTLEELAWLKKRRFEPQHKPYALIQLKCFQRLGYFPKFTDVPTSIKNFISTFVKDEALQGKVPKNHRQTYKRLDS